MRWGVGMGLLLLFDGLGDLALLLLALLLPLVFFFFLSFFFRFDFFDRDGYARYLS